MATYELAIPKDYGYVVLAVSGTFFVGLWHAFRIPSFRRASGIRYPKAYADSGDLAAAETAEKKHAIYLFNCAQRAHGNWMEAHTSVVIAMLITGLHYPLTTAISGAAWMVFRIMYAVGYTRTDKTDGSGRTIGVGHSLVALGLYGGAVWTAIRMLM